jgi:hypothetical protein
VSTDVRVDAGADATDDDIDADEPDAAEPNAMDLDAAL